MEIGCVCSFYIRIFTAGKIKLILDRVMGRAGSCENAYRDTCKKA